MRTAWADSSRPATAVMIALLAAGSGSFTSTMVKFAISEGSSARPKPAVRPWLLGRL